MNAPHRDASRRKTAETDDRADRSTSTAPARREVATGVGFFDHMLTHLAKHGLFDLTVKCKGDLHIDAHHTVEDVGICFGKALAQALGDKAGIRRYGDCTLPMDETLVTAAVDLSGRPFLVWKADVPLETLGTFSSQLAEEFWRAVSSAGAAEPARRPAPRTQHAPHRRGDLQGVCPRAARRGRARPARSGVPSTKGVL